MESQISNTRFELFILHEASASEKKEQRKRKALCLGGLPADAAGSVVDKRFHSERFEEELGWLLAKF